LAVHRPHILTASSIGRLPGSCRQRRSISHKAKSLIVHQLLATGIANVKMPAGQIGTSVINTSGKLCWFNEVSPKGDRLQFDGQNRLSRRSPHPNTSIHGGGGDFQTSLRILWTISTLLGYCNHLVTWSDREKKAPVRQLTAEIGNNHYWVGRDAPRLSSKHRWTPRFCPREGKYENSQV